MTAAALVRHRGKCPRGSVRGLGRRGTTGRKNSCVGATTAVPGPPKGLLRRILGGLDRHQGGGGFGVRMSVSIRARVTETPGTLRAGWRSRRSHRSSRERVLRPLPARGAQREGGLGQPWPAHPTPPPVLVNIWSPLLCVWFVPLSSRAVINFHQWNVKGSDIATQEQAVPWDDFIPVEPATTQKEPTFCTAVLPAFLVTSAHCNHHCRTSIYSFFHHRGCLSRRSVGNLETSGAAAPSGCVRGCVLGSLGSV